SKRLFGALGYADLGALPNYLRLLRPGRVLGRLDLGELGMRGLPSWSPRLLRLAQATGLAVLAGGLAGIALRLGAAAARLPARGLSSESLRFGPEAPLLDGVWQAASPGLRAGVVRDGRYLAGRYGGRSGEGGVYRGAVVRRGKKPRAVVVMREPSEGGDARLRGVRVATVADLLFPRDDGSAGFAGVSEGKGRPRR